MKDLRPRMTSWWESQSWWFSCGMCASGHIRYCIVDCVVCAALSIHTVRLSELRLVAVDALDHSGEAAISSLTEHLCTRKRNRLTRDCRIAAGCWGVPLPSVFEEMVSAPLVLRRLSVEPLSRRSRSIAWMNTVFSIRTYTPSSSCIALCRLWGQVCWGQAFIFQKCWALWEHSSQAILVLTIRDSRIATAQPRNSLRHDYDSGVSVSKELAEQRWYDEYHHSVQVPQQALVMLPTTFPSSAAGPSFRERWWSAWNPTRVW